MSDPLPPPTSAAPLPYVLVDFLPGNGATYLLPVKYIAGFAYGPDDNCAFCEGDSCAETDEAPERIKVCMAGDYLETDGNWKKTTYRPDHCPFCLGRAS